MDLESSQSRELGCWNGLAACFGLVTVAVNPALVHDFELGDEHSEIGDDEINEDH